MNQQLPQPMSPTATWPVQPQGQFYEPNSLRPSFTYVFGLDPAIDQSTATLCATTVNEIQSKVSLGHPFRVLIFNALSNNQYNNKEFQSLMQVIVTLIYLSLQHREFSSINEAMMKIIPHCVQAYAGALAAQTAELHPLLNNMQIEAMRISTENWEEAVKVAMRQLDYSQLGQNAARQNKQNNFTSQLNNSAIPTSMGVQSVGTHSGISGAFSAGENMKQQFNQAQYGNNAHIEGTVSPYRAQLERMQGRLSGTMQESMHAIHDKIQTQPQAQPQVSAMTQQPQPVNPRVVKPVASGADASRDFDKDVTNFDEPILYVETDGLVIGSPPAPIDVAPHLATQFAFDMDGHHHEVIGEDMVMTADTWKPTQYQKFLPVICVRTHRMRYVKTREGFTIAVAQFLSAKEKEALMDYEAHAIDANKGSPRPNAKPANFAPVREEAKILYSSAEESKDTKVSIQTAEEWTTASSVEEVIQTAILDAEVLEKKSEAFRINAVVMTPVPYSSVEVKERDLAAIEKLRRARSFNRGAGILEEIENPQLKRLLDNIICTKINETLSCEMGITNIRIKNFASSGGEISEVIRVHHGVNAGDTLLAIQPSILALACSVSTGADVSEYAMNMLTGEEESKESLIARTVFVKQDVSAIWTKYTSEELAVSELPSKGARSIEKSLTPTLHALVTSVMAEQKEYDFERNYLVTSDRVVYVMHRGLFDNSCLLLSALNG